MESIANTVGGVKLIMAMAVKNWPSALVMGTLRNGVAQWEDITSLMEKLKLE
ncbi:MAG: hypothetical protein V4481_00305 [Patescibacteria group bacterium]